MGGAAKGGGTQKRSTGFASASFLVREAGVEPARPCEHCHLKPASLPIPPLAHIVCTHRRGLSASDILPCGRASVNPFLRKDKNIVVGAGHTRDGKEVSAMNGNTELLNFVYQNAQMAR